MRSRLNRIGDRVRLSRHCDINDLRPRVAQFRMRQALKVSALYFAAVFAVRFVLRTIRTLRVAPRIGPRGDRYLLASMGVLVDLHGRIGLDHALLVELRTRAQFRLRQQWCRDSLAARAFVVVAATFLRHTWWWINCPSFASAQFGLAPIWCALATRSTRTPTGGPSA